LAPSLRSIPCPCPSPERAGAGARESPAEPVESLAWRLAKKCHAISGTESSPKDHPFADNHGGRRDRDVRRDDRGVVRSDRYIRGDWLIIGDRRLIIRHHRGLAHGRRIVVADDIPSPAGPSLKRQQSEEKSTQDSCQEPCSHESSPL